MPRFTSARPRGCRKVAGEWILVCIVLDLGKLEHDRMAAEAA
jgi:hypothetical protein